VNVDRLAELGENLMDVGVVAVEKSYAHCRQIARRAGSNFMWALWMLPKSSRRAMYALYAFARHTDDLADFEGPSPLERVRELFSWRAALESALAGEPRGEILPALADAAREYQIPHQHLFALVDGVTRDLSPPCFVTRGELEEYCHHVASSVGLACLPIWGCRDARAIEPAKACGVAFQLTNILRDLSEDAARGRCYLPQEDFEACDYSWENFCRGTNNAGFDRLMQLEIARAVELYDQAAATETYLAGGPKRLFRAMFGTYRGLLDRIAVEPARVRDGRLRVGWGRKLAIAAGAWWG
jgi:phytoene synthase